MPKFRKKPVIIEAVVWDGDFWGTMEPFCPDCAENQQGNLLIPTLEGVMTAQRGDYIIKGVNGEYYPCKPDIFVKTYEAAE